jgi:YHS domain-containing protein
MTDGKILDPICDMIVDLAEARDDGLVTEYAGREYGFCSAGCQVKFAKSPTAYVQKVEAWLAASGDHAHAAEALRAPLRVRGPLPPGPLPLTRSSLMSLTTARVATRRQERLSERMTGEALFEKDAAEVGMSVELDPEHVIGLALAPVRALPHRDERRYVRIELGA